MIFYYRLARELGITVGRLLREVSSTEITGWMAFLSLEDELKKRKKSKESTLALGAYIDKLGREAEGRKQKKKKRHGDPK